MKFKIFFGKLKAFTKRNMPIMAVSFSILLALSLVTAVAVTKVNENAKTFSPSKTEEKQEEQKQDEEHVVEPTNAEEPIVFCLPVESSTEGLPFAQDYLVKYPTLNKWQTHEGVDFVAMAGSKVVAAFDGKVESVEESGMFGMCVVVDHGNGLKTYYKSLSTEIAVKVGDKVEKGEQIGTVSNSAKCEQDEGAHLHFEVELNGEKVDPADYLPSGNK